MPPHPDPAATSFTSTSHDSYPAIAQSDQQGRTVLITAHPKASAARLLYHSPTPALRISSSPRVPASTKSSRKSSLLPRPPPLRHKSSSCSCMYAQNPASPMRIPGRLEALSILLVINTVILGPGFVDTAAHPVAAKAIAAFCLIFGFFLRG
ncbi:hypothetical protein V1519DRAFT_480852 [Lipomyces tetrasporus]